MQATKRVDGVTLRAAAGGGSWRGTVHSLIGKELEHHGGKVEYVVDNPRDKFVDIPIAALISKEYARERARRISEDQATPDMPDPGHAESLRERGHRPDVRSHRDWRGGCVCAIATDPASGILTAGADPRREYYALAW